MDASDWPDTGTRRRCRSMSRPSRARGRRCRGSAATGRQRRPSRRGFRWTPSTTTCAPGCRRRSRACSPTYCQVGIGKYSGSARVDRTGRGSALLTGLQAAQQGVHADLLSGETCGVFDELMSGTELREAAVRMKQIFHRFKRQSQLRHCCKRGMLRFTCVRYNVECMALSTHARTPRRQARGGKRGRCRRRRRRSG